MEETRAVYSRTQRVIRGFIFLFLAFVAVLILYPIVYIVLGSFKENAELLQRQQEEDKLSVGVAVLSLLAILSAFADGIGFLNEIKEAGSLMNLCRENIAYPIILVIVVLIGFVALVVCKDSAVRYWRSKRKALDRNVGE